MKSTRSALSQRLPERFVSLCRAAVSQLVTQGGFPQFLLPPVNFDALYARSDAAADDTN